MIVTLTTDFGFGEYVAAMKGVILSIAPGAIIVDVSHSIKPGNVREGAFILYSSLPFFPSAMHVAVVDPGVGTERRGIVASCEKGTLVGPDNGLLIPAAKRLGLKEVREITNKKLCLEEISATFHGRDIFAPVAAHLAGGTSLAEIGPRIEDCVGLGFGEWRDSPKGVEGEVLYTDRFGNLITNIPGDAVLGRLAFGDSPTIQIGKDRFVAKFLRSYGFGKRDRLLLTISSSGYLEIAIRDGSTVERLKVGEGTPVSLRLTRPGKEISK